MGVMGKIVGGTLGFALGGPLGAIAGAAFGHVFDKSDAAIDYDGNQRMRLGAGESSQLTFYVAAFSMLAKIIKADGSVQQSEIASVEQFMVNDLNLDPFGRNIAKNIFFTAMESDQRFEDFARQFYNEFHSQPQLLELMMDILVRVASADNSVSEDEDRLIRSAMAIFHLDETAYQTICRKYQCFEDKAYAVLQSTESDSNETIKRRYRKLVIDYHPDKIASKGLPEEFTKFANDKFIEIQEAWETIKKERGIS